MPYFMLDYAFPDYSERPDWVSGYNFNLDWGEWGYWLPWFNQLINILCDEAGVNKWQLPDLLSWNMFNSKISELYDNALWTSITRTSGDNYIDRKGISETSYADAKIDYENSPDYGTGEYNDYFPAWMIERGSGSEEYQVIGINSYASFDTSAVTAVRNARLKFTDLNMVMEDVSENPVVEVYKQDYGTLDSSDWTGGTKVGEKIFTKEGGTFYVDLDPTSITTEGTSEYRITLKAITDTDYWPEPFPVNDGDYKGYAVLNGSTCAISGGCLTLQYR